MPKTSLKRKLVEQISMIACDQLTDILTAYEVDSVLETNTIDDAIDDIYCLISQRYGIARNPVPKSNEWWQKIVPLYDERQFKHEFRVGREDFNKILNLIKNDTVFKKRQFPTEFQLSIALSRFGDYGSGSSYMKKAAQFGIGEGTIHKFTKRIIKAICRLKSEWITWPNQTERNKISSYMYDKLPNCIGYMDGTEIKLEEAPVDDHESYFSRKQQYSIKVQAIVDNNRKFIDLLIGYPGSVHDARIFVNSPFGRNPNLYLSGDEWIAADSAYTLSAYVLTPFRKSSTIPDLHRVLFQKSFSKYRVLVENAFGILKEVFGSLKELRIRVDKDKGHKYSCDWILACCILYNIIQPDPTEYHIQENFTEDMDEDFIVQNPPQIIDSAESKRRKLLQWILNQM